MFDPESGDTVSEYVNRLYNDIIVKLGDLLIEDVPHDASELEVFSALIAVQTMSEALEVRLQKFGIEEDLIEKARQHAQTHVTLIESEHNGFFKQGGGDA